MRALRHGMRNLFRHRRKAAILLALSCSLSVALSLFAVNIEKNREELGTLLQETQLRLDIVSTNGMMKTGLLINDGFLSNVEAAHGVERGLITALAYFETELGGEYSLGYMGAYTDEAPLLEAKDNVAYLTGYDGSIFKSTDSLCLLQEDYMEAAGLSPGDEIKCRISTVRDSQAYSAGEASFTIVGTYKEAGHGYDGADMVCSYDGLKRKFEEKNLHIWPKSAWFSISDPSSLNEIKRVLKENNIDTVNPRASIYSNRGYAAVINDRKYILRAEPLERQINLLTAIYPVFFAAVALIAFLACVLLAQSRRGEIAICRSLGESRGSVFFQYFTESAIVSLIGTAAGFTAAAAATNTGLLVLPFLGCLGACLLGIAGAVLLLGRTNVIAIVTSPD